MEWNCPSVRPSLNVFYDFQHGLYLIKFSRFFYFFGGGGSLSFTLLELHKILDPNRRFTLKIEI